MMLLNIKGFTAKSYLITNILLAVIFAAAIIGGPALRMGEDFTAGLCTGLVSAWLLYAILGGIELKRKGRHFDERTRRIVVDAAAISFWALIFAGSVFQILLRSETVGLRLGGPDSAALVCDSGLAVFLVSCFIVSKKI
jgi:hypothetical protein